MISIFRFLATLNFCHWGHPTPLIHAGGLPGSIEYNYLNKTAIPVDRLQWNSSQMADKQSYQKVSHMVTEQVTCRAEI